MQKVIVNDLMQTNYTYFLTEPIGSNFHIDFKECVRCDICETKLIEQTGSCRHSMERIIASTHPVSSNS